MVSSHNSSNYDEAHAPSEHNCGEPSAASRVFDKQPDKSRAALDPASGSIPGVSFKTPLTTPTTLYTAYRRNTGLVPVFSLSRYGLFDANAISAMRLTVTGPPRSPSLIAAIPDTSAGGAFRRCFLTPICGPLEEDHAEFANMIGIQKCRNDGAHDHLLQPLLPVKKGQLARMFSVQPYRIGCKAGLRWVIYSAQPDTKMTVR